MTSPPAVPGRKVIHVSTRCRTADELVEKFAVFCSDDGILVPAASGLSTGTVSPFSMALANLTVVLRGRGQVLEVHGGEPAGKGTVRVKILELDDGCRPLWGRLLARRRAAGRVPTPPPPPANARKTMMMAGGVPPSSTTPAPETARLGEFIDNTVFGPDVPPTAAPQLEDDPTVVASESVTPGPTPHPAPARALSQRPPLAPRPRTPPPPASGEMRSSYEAGGSEPASTAGGLRDLLPPSTSSPGTGRFTGRTMVARRSRLPPWLAGVATATRSVGGRLVQVVPESWRPGAARYAPWAACFVVGLLVGGWLRGAPAVPSRADAAPAAVVAPAPALPTTVAAERPREAPAPHPDCFATVTSEPEGVAVVWGDTALGNTPLEGVAVPCGRNLVVLKHARYENIVRSLVATTQDTLVLTERMRRPEATLSVTSSPPGALVAVGGRDVGETPQTLTVSRFERVEVKAAKDGYKLWASNVFVAKDEEKVNIRLQKIALPKRDRGGKDKTRASKRKR